MEPILNSCEDGWRLLALATVVFFIAAGIYFVIIPVQESKRHEQTLIERFGWADKYTLSINGSIPAHRVEAFIHVRPRENIYGTR